MPAGALPLMVLLSLLAVVPVVLWSVTLALAPLPVWLVAKEKGPVVGGFTAAAVGVAATALLGFAALPAMFVVLVLGYLAGMAPPASNPGARIALAGVFLFAVLGGLAAAQYAMDAPALNKAMNVQTKEFKKLMIETGDRAARGEAFSAEVDKLVEIFPYIFFGFVALISVWLAWLNYVATVRLAKARGLEWTSLPAFSGWQMPWFLAYGFILGLVGFLFSGAFGAYRVQAYGIGLSLLLIFGALYFIQGVAIVNFFADKYRLSPATKVFVIGVVFFMQLFVQAPSWLGLFDTWFDFRRLATLR